jgi:hypothetical protein
MACLARADAEALKAFLKGLPGKKASPDEASRLSI